jgi:hypothetical protein
MDIRPLHTEDDYRAALVEVSALVDLDPERGTPEGDRLEILSILIEDYERPTETALLLRSPANAAHLERSIAQLRAGDVPGPRFGLMKGKIKIADDFNAPLDPLTFTDHTQEKLMTVSGGSMATISKLDAAMHQLNLAIDLFLAGDYLASLTLAGAAEDILAGLSKAAGKPVAADAIADYHEKDVDPAVSAEKRRGVVFTVLNRARNTAKHADRPNENTVEVEQIHPLQMIMRAVPMCAHLGLNPSPQMEKMGAWIHDHPEAFQ